MTPKKNDLISIVVPVYNAEDYIMDTIASVKCQTYENWELLLVDDKSTDNTIQIIKQNLDERIKLIRNGRNLGAALSRNVGTVVAKGRFIAFLDADDLWLPKKLEKQLAFMSKKDAAFSFTGYEFADSNGIPNGKEVSVPATVTYDQALRNTTIFTSTVMFNMSLLAKERLLMPNIPSEDTATWWNILKNYVPMAYGLNCTLSIYRRRNFSLSSNKLRSARFTWKLYRDYENMGLLKTCYYFCNYAMNAVLRRI